MVIMRLKQINMEIRPNKITALVGLSGAGNPPLISLLDKFYQPDAGKIELDGLIYKTSTPPIYAITLASSYKKSHFPRQYF